MIFMIEIRGMRRGLLGQSVIKEQYDIQKIIKLKVHVDENKRFHSQLKLLYVSK